jgi:hypothetical protein
MTDPMSSVLSKAAAVCIPFTTIPERACLEKLSSEVPEDGVILEIGSLYGGTTAVLALANPNVTIFTVDIFEWTPPDMPSPSASMFIRNMQTLGVENVGLLEMSSIEIAKTWTQSIDLLVVDGGHTKDIVYSDLNAFAEYSQVIAVHDYGNDYWSDIRVVVDEFLASHPEWKMAQVVEWLAVLRREK